jgi:hypothetical protein
MCPLLTGLFHLSCPLLVNVPLYNFTHPASPHSQTRNLTHLPDFLVSVLLVYSWQVLMESVKRYSFSYIIFCMVFGWMVNRNHLDSYEIFKIRTNQKPWDSILNESHMWFYMKFNCWTLKHMVRHTLFEIKQKGIW